MSRVHHPSPGEDPDSTVGCASADFETRLLAALASIDRARPAATAPPAKERRTGPRSRPTVPGLRRALPIPVVAVGVLALTGTGVAASQLLDKSRVDFVPATSSLTAGTSVAVKGIGCASGAEVVFSLQDRRLATVTADPKGAFVGEVVVPADVVPGSHAMVAACRHYDGRQDLVQKAPLEIVDPAPAPKEELTGSMLVVGGPTLAGTQVGVKGWGCAPSTDKVTTRIRFALDGVEVGSAPVADDGSFSHILQLSAGQAPGTYRVTARCTDARGKQLTQKADLEVVPPSGPEKVPARPTPGRSTPVAPPTTR